MTRLFLGGLPTEPDIKRIREAFPDCELKAGDIIRHDNIERVLQVKKGSSRYQTLTTRWRKLVETESGIIIGAERGTGFKVLSDGQKVGLSGAKLRSAARFARRAYIVAGRVDRSNLTDDERTRLDHQTRCSAGIIAAAQIKSQSQLPSLN